MQVTIIKVVYMSLLVGTTCGYVSAVLTPGEYITIGVTSSSELPYAQAALSRCPQEGAVSVEVLPPVSGENTLDKSQQLKAAMVNRDFFAVIGPLTEHIAIVTEHLDIPYLVTDIQSGGDFNNIYTILPDYHDVIDCVWALVRMYKWTKVAILWEEDCVVDAVAEALDSSLLEFSMFRVHDSSSTVQIRESLRIIRQRGIKQVLILTRPDTAKSVLDMAMRLGIMAVPYSWLIVHHGNLTEPEALLEDIETNVTIVELSKNVPDADIQRNLQTPDERNALQLQAAIEGVQYICDVVAASKQHDIKGRNLTNIAKEAIERGIPLPMRFMPDGRRVGYNWSIYSHNTYIFGKFAYWVKGDSDMPGQFEFIPTLPDRPMVSWTEQISVVTIPEQPWVMLKPGKDSSCTGNHCYEGFIVDMMEHIAKQFSPPLRYKLYLVPDGAFGSLNPDSGLWNGIMAEIISRNATMSLAPLSINKQREEAVDFTKPFKTRGISVLIKTSESQSSFFQFLAPLSYKVWLAVLAAMVAVSLALCMYEKHGSSQRRDMLRITERETCWFVFGSLVQEGTESTPVTVGGRILIGAWWFFAMILLSSYTANLAAFLTIKKINTPIETVSDLVGQTKIKYGTVRDSGVLAFFQNTKIEPYRTMWTRMGDDHLVNSTAEGLRRVQQGNYAFIWDNTVNSYMAAHDCNFTEIGPSFDPKGYGIGVPSGATYRENLTLAVLALADNGDIDKLEHVWWHADECPSVQTSSQSSDTEELQLENIAGIFFVLLGGMVLGLIACIVDKYIVARFVRRKNRSVDLHATDIPSGRNGSLLTKSSQL